MTNMFVLLTLCTSLVLGQVDEFVSDTDPATWVMERGKTLARIGDWENGLTYLESYILSHPEDAEARLLLAECYFNWPDKQTVGERVVDKNLERGRVQIRILGNLGDKGFEMLLKGLHSGTRGVFDTCCEVLKEKRDRRAIDDLVRVVLENPEEHFTRYALDALVSIERDREQVDDRVVNVLMSVLKRQGSKDWVRVEAAQGVSILRIREAVPILRKELEQVAAALPSQQESEDRDRAVAEFRHFTDAIGRIAPEDLEKYVYEILSRMNPADANGLFPSRHLEVFDPETLAFFARTALRMGEADAGLYRDDLREFTRLMARDFPRTLKRKDVKEHLHELCNAPQRDVRLAVIEIVGEIRDEDAVPILLPRVRASWVSGGMRWTLPEGGMQMLARAIAPTLSWRSEEPRNTWRAVKQIGSPRTADFLLEKLESEDMAWVYTAALLLMDIGEGQAIEPLKERHSELSGADGEQAKEVREAIERAYQELSGESLTGVYAPGLPERRPMPVRRPPAVPRRAGE